jgi:hypothetical protein
MSATPEQVADLMRGSAMLKTGILPDSVSRHHSHPETRARLRELRAAIRARHAEELSAAGFWGGWRVEFRIAAEFRRERRAMVPSPEAL